MLADVSTGYPVLLTEMTLLTALRTAATSAMAARHLAPKGAKTMAMIGNGAQAEFQALAMKAVLGITHVRLFDIDPKATEKTRRNLDGSGLHVTACDSSQSAIEGCRDHHDLHRRQAICHHPHGQHGRRRGAHQCNRWRLPGKTELHRDILSRADTFVEYPPQTRIEGEIQQMAPDYR